MQFENVVARNFDVDFIYLDIILTAIWVLLLIKSNHRRALYVGVLGIVVNFIIDYVVWYRTMGVRVIYELPPWLSPEVFFVYFSITYGMIQYSYVGVMFTEGSNKKLWTLLLFTGWISIGLTSQLLSLDDSTVHVARIMSTQRLTEILVVLAEYSLLVFLMQRGKFELTWRRIGYVFGIGVLAFFAMEVTLLVPGIRNIDLGNLIFNSLIEWNMGAPIVYLLLTFSKEGNRSNVMESVRAVEDC